MINIITSKYRNIFFLPILSVLLSILALPPVGWSYLVLISLAPLYLAIKLSENSTQAFLNGTMYGGFFSGYVVYSVLSGFGWFENTEVFVWFMYLIGCAIVLLAIITWGIWFAFLFRIFQKYSYNWLITTFAFSSYALADLFLLEITFGFNYGSFVYVLPELPGLLYLVAFVPISILVGLIALFNAVLAEYMFATKVSKLLLLIFIFIVVMLPFYYLERNNIDGVKAEEEYTIAIIQDDNRDETSIFGEVRDGKFKFAYLSDLIEKASEAKPDFIVYPFNPNVGAFTESYRTTPAFDQEIITASLEEFTKWVDLNVPRDVIFVTWYTVFRNGEFYNEIGYWQNGELLGSYKKQKLFPFFDYTPQWAQEIGFYSTPFDGREGESQGAVQLDDVALGSLVCSEIGDDTVVKNMASQSGIMFAIGSEAMFSHSLPAEYNYVWSQIYARKFNTPIVRATKFGPSGIFLPSGEVVADGGFQESSIILGEISLF